MRITQIHIKNFRSIKDSGDISGVTKIFALIGRNNAGKSSFLKAIQILFLKREVEINDFHKDTTDDIEISATVKKGFGEASENKEFKIICEKDGLKISYYIDGTKQTKKSYGEKIPELLSISDIRNPNDSTTGGQKTTLLKQILKLQKSEDAAFSERLGELSEQITELKKEESKTISERITEKFRDVTNEQSFLVSITPDVDLEKGVVHKTEITDTDIPNAKAVDILNSGTGLQSMYLLSLLEVFSEMSSDEDEDKAILVVEEPEVYLHPSYQRRMFAALRRIAENNQVIFTTHSPIMIADIWLTESVRQVRLKDGETIIESVKIEDVIDELGIRYEDVLNPKLVIFVEGENDVKFYKKLGIDDPKLTIISTDGFRAIHYYAFIKIISSEHVKNEFVLIADSDGEIADLRKEKLKSAIRDQFRTPPIDLEKKLDKKIFILDKYSIESYLLDQATLEAAFPEIDAKKIRDFLEEYQRKYEEQEKELKKGATTLGEFQKYLQPKKIFEVLYSPKFEEAYKLFWKGHDTFLSIKGLIAERCREIGKSGRDPFEHLLSCADLENISELVEKRSSILSFL